MKDYGLVSIIMPSYNCEHYIAESIKSVLAQTYQNWELLITDDCSTDRTIEIVKEYVAKDERIKLILLEKNGGAGVARNKSIEKAVGRFIAFLDSDDLWYPNKLERQLKFMDEKECAISHTSYMTCDEDGYVTGIIVCRRRESLASMSRDDKMGFLTVIYDVSQLGKIYLPKLRKRQDWALKLKLLQICKYTYGMKEPLAYYRKRDGSISNNKRSLVKYNIAVYQNVLGWTTLRANIFFYFVFMPTYIIKRIFLRYLNK